MKAVNLECVLMHNNEIIFNGRSLGFLKKDEIKKFITPEKDVPRNFSKKEIDTLPTQGSRSHYPQGNYINSL